MDEEFLYRIKIERRPGVEGVDLVDEIIDWCNEQGFQEKFVHRYHHEPKRPYVSDMFCFSDQKAAAHFKLRWSE